MWPPSSAAWARGARAGRPPRAYGAADARAFAPRAGRPPRTTPPLEEPRAGRPPRTTPDAGRPPRRPPPPPSEMRSSRDMSTRDIFGEFCGFMRCAIGGHNAVRRREGRFVFDQLRLRAPAGVAPAWYRARCRRRSTARRRGTAACWRTRWDSSSAVASRRRRHRQSTDNLPCVRPTLRPSNRPPPPPPPPACNNTTHASRGTRRRCRRAGSCRCRRRATSRAAARRSP